MRWYLQHEDGHVITCQPKVWMDTGGFAMYIETVFPHKGRPLAGVSTAVYLQVSFPRRPPLISF